MSLNRRLLKMPIIYWTPAGLAVAPANLGIAIGGDHAFQTSVQQALAQINAVTSGQQLLNGIVAAITPVGNQPLKRVGIQPWNGLNMNMCAALPQPQSPEDPMTPLARAVVGNHPGNIALGITSALNAMGMNNANGFQTIAAQLNMIPNYQLQGAVAGNPVNFNVTAAQVQAWATGVTAFPFPVALQHLQALQHALLIVLQPGMNAGVGCSSRVNWNPAHNTLTIAGVQHQRPPYISLAHELIHAFNDLNGRQIGLDNNSPSTVLYEYMCVGLGPWANPANLAAMANPPKTENAIRALAHLPLRTQYG
jgi:hypothetical protein